MLQQRCENLEIALESNRRIALAMGIVMATLRCSDTQAFEHLAQLSQHRNVKLRTLAEDVVFTGTIPSMGRWEPDRTATRSRHVLTAANSIPAMLAYWDSSARNRFANNAYIRWFGRSPRELQGMHIHDLLGATLYQSNLPYIEGALDGVRQQFERTLVDAAGVSRVTHAQYIPIVNARGAPDGFTVLVTELTPRIAA